MLIAFLQVLSIWALRPWRVADPAARRDSIGVGAFNLIRREAYDALGGWEALRMEILEDLALGRRVKARGFAQRLVLGLDLVSVRWARGALGVVENLTKNLFAVFHFRPELLLGCVCGLALFTLFPLAACLAGPALWWPTASCCLRLRSPTSSWAGINTFPPRKCQCFPSPRSCCSTPYFALCASPSGAAASPGEAPFTPCANCETNQRSLLQS